MVSGGWEGVGRGIEGGASRKLQGTGNESTKELGPITSLTHMETLFHPLVLYCIKFYTFPTPGQMAKDSCYHNKRNMKAGSPYDQAEP